MAGKEYQVQIKDDTQLDLGKKPETTLNCFIISCVVRTTAVRMVPYYLHINEAYQLMNLIALTTFKQKNPTHQLAVFTLHKSIETSTFYEGRFQHVGGHTMWNKE